MSCHAKPADSIPPAAKNTVPTPLSSEGDLLEKNDEPPALRIAGEPNLRQLRATVLALATDAGLSGSSPSPGPSLGDDVAGAHRIKGGWYPKPNVPAHKTPYIVDTVEGLFATAPWSTLEGRELVVRFVTHASTGAAIVYAGVRLAGDPLAPPRYRSYATEKRARRGTKHELRMGIDRILDPARDVDGALARGFGELAWQVELPYPNVGSTVLTNGRIAFRVDGNRLVPQPTVVLGPLVHQVTETSAIVSFETSAPVTAVVGVGESAVASSAQPSRRHEVTVSGLKANTRYPYRVVISDGHETALASPRTLTTTTPGPLTIAIMSDSRSGVGPGMRSYNGVNAIVLSTLFVGALRNNAEAIFFPGDLIDGYFAHADDYDSQLRSWLSAAEGVHGQLPVYTGMGNHEALVDVWSDGVVLDKPGERSAEAHFAALMVNPKGAPSPERPGAPTYSESVYAVDIKGVHFVMLNTNYWYTRQPGHARHDGKGNREGMLMEGQLRWLANDLTEARQRGVQHIVVMGHEPAFPAGGHARDGMWWHGKIAEVNAMRERFWTLLAEHRVLAYVSGDEHNYSRSLIGPETVPGASGSVHSIISGGSGAPYYAQDAPAAYADRVRAFSGQQHYTLWTFETGQPPRLQVFGLTGGLIEDTRLSTP